MLRKTRTAIATAASVMLVASTLGVAPAAAVGPGAFTGVTQPTSVELVKKKMGRGGPKAGHGHGGNHWHGNHNHGGCWNCGDDWDDWWGPAIGFGTGLFVGSVLAQPHYYAPHSSYGSGTDYCQARFRSYNAYTRTYTGYDGEQHYC